MRREAARRARQIRPAAGCRHCSRISSRPCERQTHLAAGAVLNGIAHEIADRHGDHAFGRRDVQVACRPRSPARCACPARRCADPRRCAPARRSHRRSSSAAAPACCSRDSASSASVNSVISRTARWMRAERLARAGPVRRLRLEQLDRAAHHRERRAQLVARRRGERLLALDEAVEPLHEHVDRARDRLQLVAGELRADAHVSLRRDRSASGDRRAR